MVALLGSRSGTYSPSSLDHPRSPRAWSPATPKATLCGWSIVFGGFAALAVVYALMGVFQLTADPWVQQVSHLQHHVRSRGVAQGSDVLVMYIFSNSDALYLDNLRFFLREGAREDDGCDYIFVVNRSADEEVIDLPPLPTNARYLLHNNECYDWGTFGWIITTQGVNVDKYSYFIMMNSSVRGPFVPTYIKSHVHWADVLISKITDEVKLVGPTINCEGAPQGGNPANTWRNNPHVQSYVVATDRIGMQILLDDQNVFKCYQNMWDTVYHSELGSSAAILAAGYNIDSLMVRYQGVDWRDQSNWRCNGERNPYGAHFLDGGSLEAMEVVFVKVKKRMVELGWSYPYAATQYDKWYQASDAGTPAILANKYLTDSDHYKLPEVFATALKGMDCFDCPYYLSQNADLPPVWSCIQFFDHFINHGQFEGRNFRFVCDVPASNLLPFKPEATIMHLLPHISPEAVSDLISAKGSHLDTPTPRVTAARESAAAAAQETAAAAARESAAAATQETAAAATVRSTIQERSIYERGTHKQHEPQHGQMTHISPKRSRTKETVGNGVGITTELKSDGSGMDGTTFDSTESRHGIADATSAVSEESSNIYAQSTPHQKRRQVFPRADGADDLQTAKQELSQDAQAALAILRSSKQ